MVTGGDGFALAHGSAVDLAVAPEARGAGLGRALAATALAGSPELGAEVTAWSHGDHPAAARLAAAYGLERVRELWVMRRPASDPLPAVAVPDGIEVRSYRPEDAAEVVRVNAAAFAHASRAGGDGRGGARASGWRRTGSTRPGLLGRRHGSGLLGFHWTKRHSPELGEVYVIGIDPAAQGRGLGRVLTAAGLAHLADAGRRRGPVVRRGGQHRRTAALRGARLHPRGR